jgi:hypothetical protein
LSSSPVGLVNVIPSAAPAATIRPGGLVAAAGIGALLGGIVLRGWSFKALGTW